MFARDFLNVYVLKKGNQPAVAFSANICNYFMLWMLVIFTDLLLSIEVTEFCCFSVARL